MEGFPSGQRGETVNLLRKLRRFESFSLHHKNSMAVYWQHLSFKSHTWFYFSSIAFRKQLVYHWRHFGFNRLPFGQRQAALTYQFILSIGYQYITLDTASILPTTCMAWSPKSVWPNNAIDTYTPQPQCSQPHERRCHGIANVFTIQVQNPSPTQQDCSQYRFAEWYWLGFQPQHSLVHWYKRTKPANLKPKTLYFSLHTSILLTLLKSAQFITYA